MDEATLQRRAETARKLKAARWRAGGVARAKNKIGWKVSQLSAKELVGRSPLAENGWKANRIGRIERMERHVTPMELSALEAALEMPGLFGEVDPVKRFADEAHREAQRRAERPESGTEVRPDEDAGGAAP